MLLSFPRFTSLCLPANMAFNATWVCQVLRFHHCKCSAAFCWGFCPRLGWLAASCFRLGLHSELFTSQCLGSNRASTVTLKANGRSPRGTNQEGCKCFLANKIWGACQKLHFTIRSCCVAFIYLAELSCLTDRVRQDASSWSKSWSGLYTTSI